MSLVLSIQVTGPGFFGDAFQCEGNTEIVSQHGARIRLAQRLAPNQEITMRCIETGKKAVARVVANVNGKPNGKSRENVYGIALLDPQAAPWGINFPPRVDSAGAVGRIILECMVCHTRELGYLDGFELEVLESNDTVPRFCRHCLDSSMWKKSFEPLPSVAPSHDRNPKDSNGNGKRLERRRQVRHNIRVIACVQCTQFGEELVKVRNVSRSGLCFEGRSVHEKGLEIQVAIPYASGGGNILVPARFTRAQPVSSGNLMLYGVEYVRRQSD